MHGINFGIGMKTKFLEVSVIDWFLYGVDLIEIISIVNVGMIMYSLIKKKRANKKTVDVSKTV
jgi:hypothetical protein